MDGSVENFLNDLPNFRRQLFEYHVFILKSKNMHWNAELELAQCENEIDLLLFDMSNDDLIDGNLVASPCITHLSFKRKLLHAFHFVFSLFQRWIPTFKF